MFKENPWKVQILLDQNILHPGQKLSGNVILDLERPLNCNRIEVQLFGSARVFFVEKISKPGALIQSKSYEQQIILVNETKSVFDDGSKPQTEITWEEIARKVSPTAIRLPTETGSQIKAGKHEFKFEFDLPAAGLYTSFDAKGSAGYVRYYILVKCYNGTAVIRRQKHLFPVVVPKVLTLQPDSQITVDEMKKTSKGVVMTKIQLTKTNFLPGEAVKGVITINNNTSVSVKKALLYINQETICYSLKPEVQFRESYYNTPGMGLPEPKITAGKSLQYPIRFNVPALVPNLNISGCIQMQYHLNLDVGFDREIHKNPLIQLKIPIEIGTHITADAPPAYDCLDTNLGDAPPSYQESISGLTEALEAEFSSQYNPVCYFYSNRGFEKEENEKKNE
ncbi:unnamed protein product [Bursaphelenchus xylophilus]|uniref:(pine wood nematode) hypothetical protein n=1 Tax=Bursaphelenchus xylophilus TaxID=6326 RepID=A0A1I7SS81_BURXY|nr:unnamed protein product [Bursaphelenchus xylophilus]CAG9097945.1 unnamed protein product [Bursaphelenchus xylophilus]